MNKTITNFFSIILILTASGSLLAHSGVNYFTYLEPVPGAKCVNKEATVILRPAGIISRSSLFSSGAIIVTGNFSGIHAGSVINSDDNNSIIFKPYDTFSLGETVTVTFTSAVRTIAGTRIEPFEYSFQIKTVEIITNPLKSIHDEMNEYIQESGKSGVNRDGYADLPQVNVTNSLNPSQGNIFMSDIITGGNFSSHLMIVNNYGQFVFTRQTPRQCYDFKMQPNGHYTYYDQKALKYFELDTSYNIIDSFYCGNGYSTDLHELRLLLDGHALMMSYDSERVDSMNQVNGTDGAENIITAIGLIVQEIDGNKNVVFQWRSWDHYRIADATHELLNNGAIDYVHGNAIDVDNDNNLLVSCRHMDEVTKINRSTGEIIWRLGGKNNEFTFINDPIKFSHQHAIRRIKNGDITLFDNGNFHTPHFSRAVEYSLDETNKTATLVWQYRNTPDIYGLAMGYVQRLDNGNTMISWGLANPTITEVTPDGSKVFELTLAQNVYSYRALRIEPLEQNIVPSAFSLGQNYPNPFNPATTISFGLPNASHVVLTLYDVLGRVVSKLIDEDRSAGNYDVVWNGESNSSGVYFYRLQTGGFTSTKKMMLVK